MKKLIMLLVLLVSLVTPAIASDESYCADSADIMLIILQGRYDGVMAYEARDSVKNAIEPGRYQDLCLKLIDFIYSQPIFEIPTHLRDEFKGTLYDHFMEGCLETRTKKRNM